jgi:hypothetical protein
MMMMMMASIRGSEILCDLLLQLQQAFLASNKQVSAFATNVVNLLQDTTVPEAATASSIKNDSTPANHIVGSEHTAQEAPSTVQSIFAHGGISRTANNDDQIQIKSWHIQTFQQLHARASNS